MRGSQSNKGTRRSTEDIVIDYLDNELTPQQKVEFEKRMKQDTELSESVRLQRQIKYAFENPHLKDDIALIENARKSVKAEKIFSKRTVLRVAAFIALIVVATFLLILIQTG
ncbi:MAG: anti-sigma factor family protein [Chitinophagales bacterium]